MIKRAIVRGSLCPVKDERVRMRMRMRGRVRELCAAVGETRMVTDDLGKGERRQTSEKQVADRVTGDGPARDREAVDGPFFFFPFSLSLYAQSFAGSPGEDLPTSEVVAMSGLSE